MIRNRFRNAATDDLAVIDKAISEKIAQIADYTAKRANAAIQLAKCNNAGPFYNCEKNTGKTKTTWSNYISSWNIAIAKWELELKKLRAERELILSAGKSATEIAQKEAEVAKIDAEISAVNASKYGKYIFIGVGVLAVIVTGVVLYKKYKK